ncbi:MAG: AraC family transcriptional regulator [Bifidobacterium sp.]|nr:AraC family transcriptional regulator [Bifidobacterium sp.]
MEDGLYYIHHPLRPTGAVDFAFCGISQTMPSHSFGPALRDSYIVHIVIGGEGLLFSHGVQYKLRAHNGFVIRPDDGSFYEASDTHPWAYVWMGFKGHDVDCYLRDSGLGVSSPAVYVDVTVPFVNVVSQCFSYTAGTLNDELKLESLGYEFLHLLGEHIDRSSVRGEDTDFGPNVNNAIGFVVSHYGEGLSTGDVASHLNVDRSYLSREFHAKVGITLKQYIDSVCITKACDLLAMTDMSVKDVAASCGFSGVGVFGRKFKLAKDVAPVRYREIRHSVCNEAVVKR